MMREVIGIEYVEDEAILHRGTTLEYLLDGFSHMCAVVQTNQGVFKSFKLCDLRCSSLGMEAVGKSLDGPVFVMRLGEKVVL